MGKRYNKTRLLAFLITWVVGFSCIALFQNCGQGFEANKIAGFASLNSTDSPTPEKFRAGDPYNKLLLPYGPAGRLASDVDTYPSVTSLKALAVAKNGLGLGTGSPRFKDQNEANKLVLQQCELIAGQPCSLFAEGDFIKYKSSEFEKNFVSMIASGARSYAGSDIPTLLSGHGYRESSDYLNYCATATAGCSTTHKALAFGPFGKAVKFNGNSQAEANRRALESCEAIDGHPCTVYAEGSNVVFNLQSLELNSTPVLKYSSGTLNPSLIPFLTSAQQANLSTSIAAAKAAGENYVLALSRFGHFWLYRHKTQATADMRGIAQSLCNANITTHNLKSFSCMVYSVNDTVVFSLSEVIKNNTTAGTWLPNAPAPPLNVAFVPPADSLRSLAKNKQFYIGAALNSRYLRNPQEPMYARRAREEFNLVIPEIEGMISTIQYIKDANNYSQLDGLVSFAVSHGMRFRGHPLAWHLHNPPWLLNGGFTPAQLSTILENHIKTTVGRYRAKYPNEVFEWVVVNEAHDDGATAPLRSSVWSTIGSAPDDYIKLAFQWASQADPKAKLYYNDYMNEGNTAKANATYNLVKKLKDAGIPIHGVGLQSHVGLNNVAPVSQSVLGATIDRYAAIGIEVSISEFDMSLNPPTNPTTAQLNAQAAAYETYLKTCLAKSNCTSFATWGVSDKHSWIPSYFPGWGSALIFDSSYNPKPHIYPLLKNALK